MISLQQLMDFIEYLQRLDAYGTLGGWLAEHALFTLLLVAMVAVWAVMTVKDFSDKEK